MMTDKHTPGPWRVDDNYVLCLYDGRPNNICRMLGRGDETEANARLIAAAPDLLEACEVMVAAYDEGLGISFRDGYFKGVALMRKAVKKAKAEGES